MAEHNRVQFESNHRSSAGQAANREVLRDHSCSLPVEVPRSGMVARLNAAKGKVTSG